VERHLASLSIADPEPRSLSMCAAPFVAMEFDQFGDVQACCANALYPLGNVRDMTVREIWEGERAQTLRAAVQRNDMNYGCGVCRHRLEHGYGELPLEYYDNFPMSSLNPQWPHSLQFSLHNTCNLECTMCGADRSSKIRSRRAHLPPLPHAYGDAFFEQIEPFLHHAGAVDFSGGEPFLVTEHYRIWQMLAAMEKRPLCSLTTNGTIWNERVEEILEQVPSHICVSIDGTTAATFESVRTGASFANVMENFERFDQYTNRMGTELSISWSLVRQNWFELGLMMRFAEERGIKVKVQTVIEPEFGVQRMATSELALVIESLEIEGEALLPVLDINRDMWLREVKRLQLELESRSDPRPAPRYMEPPSSDNVAHVTDMINEYRGRVPTESSPAIEQRSRQELIDWGGAAVGTVRLGTDGKIAGIDLAAPFPGLAVTPATGATSTFAAVLRAMTDATCSVLWIADEVREADRLLHTLWLGRPMRDKVGTTVRMISHPSPGGITVHIAADRRFVEQPSGSPVALQRRVG